MFDTEQWLNETYGLAHLKTFESKPRLMLFDLLDKYGKIPVHRSPAVTDRWDVYLIVK
jgi:hypothetical protein